MAFISQEAEGGQAPGQQAPGLLGTASVGGHLGQLAQGHGAGVVVAAGPGQRERTVQTPARAGHVALLQRPPARGELARDDIRMGTLLAQQQQALLHPRQGGAGIARRPTQGHAGLPDQKPSQQSPQGAGALHPHQHRAQRGDDLLQPHEGTGAPRQLLRQPVGLQGPLDELPVATAGRPRARRPGTRPARPRTWRGLHPDAPPRFVARGPAAPASRGSTRSAAGTCARAPRAGRAVAPRRTAAPARAAPRVPRQCAAPGSCSSAR